MPGGTLALDSRRADAATACVHRLQHAHAAQGGVRGACSASYPYPTAWGTGLDKINHTIALFLRSSDFNESQERARGAPRNSVVAFARHSPQRTPSLRRPEVERVDAYISIRRVLPNRNMTNWCAIHVPFQERRLVRALGCTWDARLQQWGCTSTQYRHKSFKRYPHEAVRHGPRLRQLQRNTTRQTPGLPLGTPVKMVGVRRA